MTDECDKFRREREDRERKRGSYWLTEEGRAEIREVWSDPEDGAIPLPLLNALEASEERARRAEQALAFAASVIKSGEPWTETCERIIGAVLSPPPAATAKETAKETANLEQPGADRYGTSFGLSVGPHGPAGRCANPVCAKCHPAPPANTGTTGEP